MVEAVFRSFSVDSLIFILGKDSVEEGLADENTGGVSLENILTTRFWSFASSGFIVGEGILIGDILLGGLDDGCDRVLCDDCDVGLCDDLEGGIDDFVVVLIDDFVVVLVDDFVVVVRLFTGDLVVLENGFFILPPSS